MTKIKCPNKKCEYSNKEGICTKEEIEMRRSIQQNSGLETWSMFYCEIEKWR